MDLDDLDTILRDSARNNQTRGRHQVPGDPSGVGGVLSRNSLRRTWEKMPANRETAFIEAITSAAITHTLTKNCSTGEFTDCGCDARMTKRRK